MNQQENDICHYVVNNKEIQIYPDFNIENSQDAVKTY